MVLGEEQRDEVVAILESPTVEFLRVGDEQPQRERSHVVVVVDGHDRDASTWARHDGLLELGDDVEHAREHDLASVLRGRLETRPLLGHGLSRAQQPTQAEPVNKVVERRSRHRGVGHVS